MQNLFYVIFSQRRSWLKYVRTTYWYGKESKRRYSESWGVASYQLQEVVERTIAELENMKRNESEEV